MFKKINQVDPRDALNKAIEVFGLKASDISELSGVSPQALSRYRNKHQDFQSLTLYKVVSALPQEARIYFSSLLSSDISSSVTEAPSEYKT